MISLKQVNARIKALGIDAELEKDNGYFYFFGFDVRYCKTTMVYCNRLNQYTMEQWMEDLDSFVRENESRVNYLSIK